MGFSTERPVRSLPPSKPATGPAPPRRSVCAPEWVAVAILVNGFHSLWVLFTVCFSLGEGLLMSEVAIGKGLFTNADWLNDIRNAKGFVNFNDGPLWASMMFECETKMHLIRNKGGTSSTLTDTVEKAVKDNPRIRLVIAGSSRR
jgi:hypothetical protein